MPRRSSRKTPLVLVASQARGAADALAALLNGQGVVAYATHSPEACLRVATAVGPDVVVLDGSVPQRLDRLLKAHPVSADARVVRVAISALAGPEQALRATGLGPRPLAA